jgi:hypothetical protein
MVNVLFGEVPQDTININDNTSTEPSKKQNEMETQVQQTNQNSGATHTEELLKETTCALKTATEALSSNSTVSPSEKIVRVCDTSFLG